MTNLLPFKINSGVWTASKYKSLGKASWKREMGLGMDQLDAEGYD